MRRPFFLLPERVSPGAGACLLALCLVLCLPAGAQLGAIGSVPATAQAEVPQDPLGRTTPRGTVLGFLLAARKGQDELAVQYLNISIRGKAAEVLAHQLFTVLDRHLPANLPQISDRPEGSLSNLLSPNEERLVTVKSNNGDVDIALERVDRGQSRPLWLFSRKTLDSIPDLYEEATQASVEDVLPQFMTHTRIEGIALFNWLAVFVGLPLFYYFTLLLNRFLSPLIGRLRRHLYRKPALPHPEFLPVPVRLLLLAIVIHWIITSVSLPHAARQVWSSTATVISIAAIVWLLILVNGWSVHYFHRLLNKRNSPVSQHWCTSCAGQSTCCSSLQACW